jgi:hypothetical protein
MGQIMQYWNDEFEAAFSPFTHLEAHASTTLKLLSQRRQNF